MTYFVVSTKKTTLSPRRTISLIQFRGNRGPVGPQGQTGPAGPQGVKGDTGEQGPVGPQGERGIQGEKGDIGAQGPQGVQGPVGATGSQGPKGDKGDTGSQGPQGIQGPQGVKGDTGDVGPQGPAGQDGAQGPKGDTGATGSQGEQGPIGATGPKGDKGDQGDPATNLVQSVNGKQGAVSITYTDVGADAAGTAASLAPIYGTGFPEGVVTATVGRTYIDTNATNGAIQWIKRTGSGNTGWVVSVGNTGWRNISTSLINGWAPYFVNSIVICRDANTVFIKLDGLKAQGSTGNTFIIIPSGFRTTGANSRFELHSLGTQPSSMYRGYFATDGGGVVSTASPSFGDLFGELSYLTTQAWPATLPGTPA